VLLAKVASTASTVGSGAVGGVFTPTLFIGAAVGALTGSTLRLALPHMSSDSSAFAVVGMGGFLAATTHAPLTSVLMIFEMTLDHQVVLPLILACVTAHYVAKVYRGGASIYRESLMPSAEGGSAWQLRTVADLIRPAAAVVKETVTVEDMLRNLPRRAVRAVYIVNDEGELTASIDPRKAFADMQQGLINPYTRVQAVSTPMNTTLTPDMSLTSALELFLRENETVLPVISGPWRTTLLGEIARHDLMLAVQDRMTEALPH
jgi:CIC family chloride channel protein